MRCSALPALRETYWRAASGFRQMRARSLPAMRQFANVALQTVKRRHASPGPAARRLLLLAWEFPPLVSGGVYRPLSFVRHAASAGWDVEVVCAEPVEPLSPAGKTLASRVPPTVRVQRVAQDIGAHPWPLPQLDGGLVNALSLYRAALTSVRTDATAGVILASGPPFHSFVSARWLARRTGWPLVLDYRDEWTESPHGFNRRDPANRKWEARCHADADLVLFTTPSQLEHQVATFSSLDRSKCAVVYNGWEPSDFDSLLERPSFPAPRRDHLTVTFVGNLGPWWEIETFLVDAVGAIKMQPCLAQRLRLRFVGRIHPAVGAVIERFSSLLPIVTTGELPKAEACREMLDADMLLMPNPSRLARYIPGKTYEYIAAGPPILVHGTGGEVQQIVDQLGVGTVVAQQRPDLLAKVLVGIVGAVTADAESREQWLAERTREAAARRLCKLMDGLLDRPAGPSATRRAGGVAAMQRRVEVR